jgi:hypothetical protein
LTIIRSPACTVYGGQPDQITIGRDLDFYRTNPPSHRGVPHALGLARQ